jgi:hypothetical protein
MLSSLRQWRNHVDRSGLSCTTTEEGKFVFCSCFLVKFVAAPVSASMQKPARNLTSAALFHLPCPMKERKIRVTRFSTVLLFDAVSVFASVESHINVCLSIIYLTRPVESQQAPRWAYSWTTLGWTCIRSPIKISWEDAHRSYCKCISSTSSRGSCYSVQIFIISFYIVLVAYALWIDCLREWT